MNNLTRNTITSMEVAEMVGKKHCDLLRDIRKYVDQLGESKIAFTDFFKEATYTTEQNKILPCFQVTKKGCEFIAHKLTGQKGTEFTARCKQDDRDSDIISSSRDRIWMASDRNCHSKQQGCKKSYRRKNIFFYIATEVV